MKHATLAALAAISMLVCGGAQAGAPAGSVYIAPELLWVNPDNDICGAREDTRFHVAVGTTLTENWDAEIGYSDTNHDSPYVGKVSIRGLDLTFNRVFNRDGRISPFIGAGLTSLSTKFRDTGFSSDNLGGKFGAGLTADLVGGEQWKLQALGELGTRVDKIQRVSGDKWDPYAGIGLRIAFGGRSPQVLPPSAPVAAAPAAAPPAPPIEAAPVAPPPPPPADDDHDGVPNAADRCPNTPAGDKVDAAGCGLTIQLQVNFDTNSAHIKPESYAELDNFVAFLKQVPSARGELEGHTDSVGSDAYNLKLSQARADAVKAYVVDKGSIDAARLTTKGYGESHPVADNGTQEGRAQNRRVLFVRSSLQQ